jgi:hypothetical protein
MVSTIFCKKSAVKFAPISAYGCTVTYMALTFDSEFNRIVRYQFAADANEVTEVLADLPLRVASELAVELRDCSEALRYDGCSERAFYFQSEGSTLAIWIWNDVDASEACDLLLSIDNLDHRLTEATANEAFFQATGRSISEPRSYLRALIAPS